ncbi:MAG: hypothetical protein ABSD10_00775 [Candidatus Saccharimonadales bacterium]|jgi:hypothetical protein
MATPEIKIVGPEYDGAEAELGTLADKVTRIAKHVAGERYGKEHVVSPTDIQIAPMTIEDEGIFVIRSWHETAAREGMVGILQPTEGSYEIVVDDENAYLHHRVEDGSNYMLTTVEAMTISDLGRLAAVYDAISSPIEREAT